MASSSKTTTTKPRNQQLPKSLATRIKILSIRIHSLPGFSNQEFSKTTGIQYQTFLRWRKEGNTNPNDSSLEALRKYIRVKRDIFDNYLKGKITIDTLWESRNSDVSAAKDVEDIISVILLLSFEDKLTLLNRLPTIVTEHYQSLNNQTTSEDSKDYIDLSDRARKRLKGLLDASLLYSQRSLTTLIKAGADGALLEAINDTTTGDKFTTDSYKTITPFLLVPIQWVSDSLPVVDPNTSFGEDVEALLDEVEIRNKK